MHITDTISRIGLALLTAMSFSMSVTAANGTHMRFGTPNAVAATTTHPSRQPQSYGDIFIRKPSPYSFVGNRTGSAKASSPRTPALRAADTPSGDSKLYAVYTSSESGYFDYGVYSLPTSVTDGETVEFTMVKDIMDMDLANCAGAVYANGRFFYAEESKAGSYVFRMTYHLYDTETWSEISSDDNGDTEFFAQDMTYDPVSGNVYGFFVKNVGSERHSVFGTLDITTGTVTDITDMGTMAIRAVSASADGLLFGIGADGILYRIGKSDGSLTAIGNTGLHSEFITTGAIDPQSGLFYYYLCNSSTTALYTVDINTAAAKKLYDCPVYDTSLAGMYVIAPAAAPKAPAAVQNLALEFNGSSLSGFVKFTTPYTLFDDSGATGDIDYTVTLNGETVLQGVTSFGVRMALPLTVPSSGEYTVGVRVSNDAGRSPLVQTSRWIGSAIPAQLRNVTLVRADNRMLLSWDEPEALAGEGFNPDAVTYRIVRYPGAVTVAENHTGLSFSETIDAPDSFTEFYYEVTAIFEGSEAAPSQSNRVATGDIVPPFSDTFDVASSLAKYTVLDANADNVTWEWLDRDGDGCISTGYSGTSSMNEWLILPAARLRKDVQYQILFDASVMASTPRHFEKMEVLIGTSPDPASLTGTIIPVTEFRNTTPEETKEFFSVTDDGTYYIALHVCSDRDMYRLHIDNLRISAPVATTVPDAVSDITVTPAADGSLKATISFTAPAADIEGNRLQSLSGVRIYRDDTLLGETNPAIGQRSTFTDSNASEGENTYRLIPYNESGDGREATVTRHIGVASPVTVTGFTGRQGADNGEVILSWNPVETDINGFTLSPALVTYTVCRIEGQNQVEVQSGITVTSFTHRACAPDATQEFAYYTVMAETSGGKSTPVVSNMIAVGAPYAARFAESFAGGGANSIWYNMAPAYPMNGSWVGTTPDVTAGYGMMPQDADNGMLLFGGPFIGCEAYIFSGKIALTGIDRPALTFYYFNDGSGNILDVVAMTDMMTPQTIGTFTLSKADDAEAAWVKAVVDLSAYKGQTVQIGFRGEVVSQIVIGVDNVRIVNDVEHNLTAVAVNAPATVKPAAEFTVSVSLLNTGRNHAEGYQVHLYRDGTRILSGNGLKVAPDGTSSVQFTDRLSPASDATVTYHAEIEFASDGDKADNITAPMTVKVMHNSYPAITDLSGATDSNGIVTLSWSEPDPSTVSIAVTDDVETLTPFSIGLASSELGADDSTGDWTMIDGDGSLTYGIDANSSDDDWVRFPNTRKEMAFQVFNGELAGVRGWDAYSGKQMFACFAATVAPNNDWLISPELNGKAQTISFMARSISPQYQESFEFLYSTTGKSVADFKRTDAVATVPAEWTEYRYELPEGARYFAIRCNSYDAFALLVDYITYVGMKNPAEELAIVGYNIYRDGTLLNPEPIMEPEFTDTEAAPADSRYRVTTVYNLGESAPSNVYSPAESSIDGVADNAPFSIRAVAGAVEIAGADGLTATVFAADGTTHAVTACAQLTRIPLRPGIYIVRVGSTAAKVLVH